MTRAEAEARCTELNGAAGEAPDGRWLVQESSPGEWRAVKVRVAGLVPTPPISATTEARPRPPHAPDPRTGPLRDVPPYGAG
jgi:hypothetical protein